MPTGFTGYRYRFAAQRANGLVIFNDFPSPGPFARINQEYVRQILGNLMELPGEQHADWTDPERVWRGQGVVSVTPTAQLAMASGCPCKSSTFDRGQQYAPPSDHRTTPETD